MLHLDGLLGRQEHFITVDRRLKPDAALAELAHGREREHLESARVGQYRTVPVHEFVQSAVLANDLCTRPQHQVKCIAEDDLGAVGGNFLRRDALDGAVGADRHEHGGPHGATAKSQHPASRRLATAVNVEPHPLRAGVRNIESP